MNEMLEKLYSYEYFGLYLLLSIIVLVLLFLVVLFFGKKDKVKREIEATRKLELINAEAFKEEEIKDAVEVKVNDELTKDNELENAPVINNESTIFDEPLLERIEEKPLKLEDTLIFNMNNEVKKEEVIDNTLVKEEENIIVNEVTNNKEEQEVEEFNFETMEVPVFNLEEIVKDVENVKNTSTQNSYSKGPQIFSSVYVPEKKEEIPEKVEVPVEKALEDISFELPTLKNEEKENGEIKVPELTDYNLNELSGETYTIK